MPNTNCDRLDAHGHRDSIERLVASNPCQMSLREYTAMCEIIAGKAPCNLLVFGVGNDSQLWCEVNCGGKTVFVEDSELWIEKVRAQLIALTPDIRKVCYKSRLTNYGSVIAPPQRLRDMPEWIRNTSWDVIIIDGPMGYLPHHPGRLQPILWTATLAAQRGIEIDVFVHDADRVVERLAGLRFFGNTCLSGMTDRLAHYRLTARSIIRRWYDILFFAAVLPSVVAGVAYRRLLR